VIDRSSHFGGKYEIANERHSDPWYFNADDENLHIISAKEDNAYPGTKMQRTILLWNNPDFIKPVVIDLFTADSEEEHLYELPFHFAEHLMQTNFSYTIYDDPFVMGDGHGYQHLYAEAKSDSLEDNIQFTWFNEDKLFTMTAVSASDDEVLFHKKQETKNPVFLSVIESHGVYSPVSEIPTNPYSNIEEVKMIFHSEDYSVFSIKALDGKLWEFMLAHKNKDENMLHGIKAGGKIYSWLGPFELKKNSSAQKTTN